MSECEGATPETELAMSRDCTESPLSSGSTEGTFSPPPSEPKFVAPRRPALGVEGRTISLRANHLEVSVRPGYIYQYRVNIIPGGCPRRVNREIVRTMVECYSQVWRTSAGSIMPVSSALDWLSSSPCLIFLRFHTRNDFYGLQYL